MLQLLLHMETLYIQLLDALVVLVGYRRQIIMYILIDPLLYIFTIFLMIVENKIQIPRSNNSKLKSRQKLIRIFISFGIIIPIVIFTMYELNLDVDLYVEGTIEIVKIASLILIIIWSFQRKKEILLFFKKKKSLSLIHI